MLSDVIYLVAGRRPRCYEKYDRMYNDLRKKSAKQRSGW
jgi:hypothetical protein